MLIKLRFLLPIFIFVVRPIAAQYDFEKAFPNISFTNPLDLQNASDGTNRLFVVEQAGKIKVFQNQRDVNSTKVFLDITDRVTSGGETGLLGLTFHPNFKNNGYFYVNYTANNPLRSIISRFKISSSNPDSADRSSELIIMSFNQPYSNHNGGCIAFGADGFLYISTGDGGSGGDPDNNAQNITNLLGKILRIDVNNTQTSLNYSIPADNPFVDSTNVNIRKEIFAWGLRNPWRFSFDPVTNHLWVGDVGQSDWEEIDIIEKGKNYGWRCFEGTHSYNNLNCDGIYEMPIWEYSHTLGISITGGYVYRGKNVPELFGKYIFGDFGSKRLWALQYDEINPAIATQITTAAGPITAFGIDEQQELYLVSFDGNIYRFVPTLTSVDEENIINDFQLFQNFPNPFNPSTKIKFNIPNLPLYSPLTKGWNEVGIVTLKVYDVLGNEVATLVNEYREPGSYQVEFNPASSFKNLASGVYFYQLKIENPSSSLRNIFVDTKKMILLK